MNVIVVLKITYISSGKYIELSLSVCIPEELLDWCNLHTTGPFLVDYGRDTLDDYKTTAVLDGRSYLSLVVQSV